jgi:Phosphotransferase enzyme family
LGDRLVAGIERAVFGEVTEDYVIAWLDRHVQGRLSTTVRDVFLRTGRVTAVYGLRLNDGSVLAAKVHRHPVSLARLAAATTCQRILANAGFPCPVPVDGPATNGSHAVVLESWMDVGERADAADPAIRLAMARALAEQMDILKSVPPGLLADDRPAWTVFEGGPWPTPHDAIFDFTTTPPGFEWLERIAQDAADVLHRRGKAAVIGHGDWVCQNMRFRDGAVTAAYDWDSLIGACEPVIAGLSAGAFPEGGTSGGDAPTPAEVAMFLTDYDGVRGTRFSGREQARAAAAATWVLAYNARCGLSLQERGFPQHQNSPLRMLAKYRGAYMSQRW